MLTTGKTNPAFITFWNQYQQGESSTIEEQNADIKAIENSLNLMSETQTEQLIEEDQTKW